MRLIVLLIAFVALVSGQPPAPPPVHFSVTEQNSVPCGAQELTICRIHVVNNDRGQNVEFVSTSIDFTTQYGLVVGTTPSINNPDQCTTSGTIPNLAAGVQSFVANGGGWTANGINGSIVANSGFTSALGNLTIWNIALSGLGVQSIFGTVRVNTISQVVYSQQFCCGARCVEIINPAKDCVIGVDLNSVQCPVITKRDTNVAVDERALSEHAARQSSCHNYYNAAGFYMWNLPTINLYLSTLDLTANSGVRFTVIAGDGSFNSQSPSAAPPFNPPADALTIDGIFDTTDVASIGVSASGLRAGTWQVEVWSWDNSLPNLGIHDLFWGVYSGSNTPLGPVRSTYNPSPSVPGRTDLIADGSSTYFISVKIDPSCTVSCKGRLNGFRLTFVDVVPPVLTCEDVTQYVNTPTGTGCTVAATWDRPTTVEDNCPLPAVVLPTEFLPGLQLEDLRSIGTYHIIYDLEDTSHNTGRCEFQLTIADIDPPSFWAGCVPDITVNAETNLCGAVVTWDNPSTSRRDCFSPIVATYESGYFFPVGTTIDILIATDILGRTASCSFSVTVIDTQPPVNHCPARNVAMRCGPGYQSWLANGGFAAVTDNCPLTITASDVPAYCGQDHIGAPTRSSGTFTATDQGGVQIPLGSAWFETADGSCTCDNRITPWLHCVDNLAPANTQFMNVTGADQFLSQNPPVPPYRYEWSTGETTQWITAPYGSYSVTVYDSLGKVGFGCFDTHCSYVAAN